MAIFLITPHAIRWRAKENPPGRETEGIVCAHIHRLEKPSFTSLSRTCSEASKHGSQISAVNEQIAIEVACGTRFASAE